MENCLETGESFFLPGVMRKSSIHSPSTFHTTWSFTLALAPPFLACQKGNLLAEPCTEHSVESIAKRLRMARRIFLPRTTAWIFQRMRRQSSSKKPAHRSWLASQKVDLGTPNVSSTSLEDSIFRM